MATNARIRILSLNTGRTDNLGGVFQLVRSRIHIILLQEVVMSQEQLENIVQGRGFRAVVSRGEGMLGVGVLIHESLPDAWVENLHPGRLQACWVGGFKILNVYGPAGTNLAQQRRTFLTTSVLAACRNSQMVMAGDFNCVAGPLDVEENYRNKRSMEMIQVVQTFSLRDFFREEHPYIREYTFHRPGSTSARLDRIYLTQDVKGSEWFSAPTLSDHEAIGMVVELPTALVRVARPKANWKLNTSILQDQDVRSRVEQMVEAADLMSHPEQWEKVKEDITVVLKDFSQLKGALNRGTFQFLTWNLEQALGEKNCSTVAYLKDRLKGLIHQKLQGFMVRFGCSQQDEEDLATLFHAKKEMVRRKGSGLTEMKIGDQLVTDPGRIKLEVEQYYNALYNGHHRTIGDSLVNTGQNFSPCWEMKEEFFEDLPTLPEYEADLIHAVLTEQEVKQVLEECRVGAAPGPDGLSYEFYKTFNRTLAPVLAGVFNHYLEEGRMPKSYKVASTRLIPKVDGIPSIDQLRPITLQSCEYKIMSKIFTKRLLGSLEHVIGPWQHCAIPGRAITTPLVNTLSTVEYADCHGINCYVLSTDIFKAYDRTHVGFILEIMKRMEYSQRTLEILQLMLEGCETVVQVFEGVRVLIIQGLKQGDPLSVPLFIINMEPLIRSLAKVTTGVQVGPVCQRVEGFMDDVNIFSTRRSDLRLIDGIFRRYERLSCTLLSRSRKTKIMGLGEWKDEDRWELPWVQSVTDMRILGIQLATSVHQSCQLTWEAAVRSIRSLVQQWVTRRGISLAGKVRLLNKLILAKLWYGAQILPIQQQVVDQVHQSMSFFLFNDKVERISLDQLYAAKELGGLGLVNVQAKCQALLAKTGYWMVQGGSKHLRYWMALRLREHLLVAGPRAEVSTDYFKSWSDLVKEAFEIQAMNRRGVITTKRLYLGFMETPPPSRVQELNLLPVETVCRRMHRVGDSVTIEFYFQIVTNTLPTKARLHYLNPRRWEDSTCTWCRNSPASTFHIFTQCRAVVEIWEWLRAKIFTLSRESVTWSDEQVLWLQFPRDKYALEIAYLTMKVTQLWWMFQKEARILTVRRLKALIQQDIRKREINKVVPHVIYHNIIV